MSDSLTAIDQLRLYAHDPGTFEFNIADMAEQLVEEIDALRAPPLVDLEMKPLVVAVEGDHLVIRVGVGTLATAVKYDPQMQVYDEGLDDFFSPEVLDETVWANEVSHALSQEEEDGTTLVHRMLDKAAAQALENGGEGAIPAEEVRDRARAEATKST